MPLMRRRYSKKAIIALSALLGIGTCEAVGNGINCATSCSIVKASYGYNNRIRNDEFNSEFHGEISKLEKIMLEKNKAAETEITYDIYVSPLIKSFFDDANNPNDNARWAKEVEAAASGLETFRQYGIGFNLRHVGMLRDGLEQFSIDTMFHFVAESQNPKPGMTFLLLPASVSNQSLISRLFWLELGSTDINGSYAMVYMTNNGTSNMHTFAHETGHMLGLPHREYNRLLRALDPFNVFCGGLMMLGNTSLGDYALNEEDIEIINKSKRRFE